MQSYSACKERTGFTHVASGGYPVTAPLVQSLQSEKLQHQCSAESDVDSTGCTMNNAHVEQNSFLLPFFLPPCHRLYEGEARKAFHPCILTPHLTLTLCITSFNLSSTFTSIHFTLLHKSRLIMFFAFRLILSFLEASADVKNKKNPE